MAIVDAASGLLRSGSHDLLDRIAALQESVKKIERELTVIAANAVLADKGYDASHLIDKIVAMQAAVVIPPK